MKDITNKKENIAKKDVLTGAVKGITVVGLSALIVGSCAFRVASIECGVNHSAEAICPITKLETMLFGIEAGIKHQAGDLEHYHLRYSDHDEYVSDVAYELDGETPSLTFNEVYEYSDKIYEETKGWDYVDGEFVPFNLENDGLTKTLRK